MKQAILPLFLGFWLLIGPVRGQMPPRQFPPTGYFLTDSIEIGRPFRYSLTYHHAPTVDVLFPDTAHSFAPYRVQKVAVFATQTNGDGTRAVSRDSAVYTLVSFETDSVQLLRVPVRTINAVDCTAQWTLTDTVFLRSKLARSLPDSLAPRSLTLATETTLAPLQQQFNYGALLIGFLGVSLVLGALYLMFGRLARQQWRLYVLNRRHVRFLREYTRLNERISPLTAADIANQAVVMWKLYLEQLDPQPYSSLTTSELADRFHDERVANALRDADQMIYGGTFTAQSQSALLVLSDVATQMYIRSRTALSQTANPNEENNNSATSSESASSS
ncbi:hypothetical protein [Spirosoma sp.]|uniref:hypothetical protein n=1 Tax=Spirosoma sp. TaxID=1899569 RepID=UPI0026175837|nr:hypothetical protein [Spirosoma sp.]MCX6214699.1 hypothetical protein [Spirosoma sp.]